MIIVGCDYHPSFQEIAYVDTESGELNEQSLEHREAAEAFYRKLASRGKKVRVGMEASGHARWFERLLSRIGDRVVAGGRGCDPSQARPAQAQDGSPECAAHSAPHAQGGFSQDLGAELGESGSAATVVASAPHGASAHTPAEPTASGGPKRRLTLQKEVVAGERTKTTRGRSLGSLGEPAAGGSAEVTGWAEPGDCRTDTSH